MCLLSDVQYTLDKFCLFEQEYQVPEAPCCLMVFYTAISHQICLQVELVATATDVASATNLIKIHKPDLLFLDIQMGTHTGFDLLNLLPDKSFEVIFVTAYDHYGIQAVKFAALDYLLKPVDIDELMAAVKKSWFPAH